MIEDFDANAPTGDDLWLRARNDYLAGESASTVCERYRLNRSTFFARAKAEGWRRSDSATTSGPDPYVAEMEAALVFELMGREPTLAYLLQRRAWAMAEIALLQRRRMEAQSWIRIARDLRKLVIEETGVLTWTRAVQVGEAAMPTRPPSRPVPDALNEDGYAEAAFGGGAQDAPVTAPPVHEARAREARAPEAKAAKRRLPDPEWGILPMSICTSRRKLETFLYGEFADAWAEADASDRSDRTTDSFDRPSSSPLHGEVAAQRTEGPHDRAEDAAATVPLGEEPSPLPASPYPPITWGR